MVQDGAADLARGSVAVSSSNVGARVRFIGMRESLAVRLSIGLALQSLAVLAIVCAAVYAWTRHGLHEQQAEVLDRHRVQVLHLFSEAQASGDLQLLKHKLGDMLVGQTLLAVEVTRDDGRAFFSAGSAGRQASARTLVFDVPDAGGSAPPWRSRLSLNVGADDATLSVLAASLAFAAATGALLISAGGAVLVKRGLRPVGRLVAQTRSLSAQTRNRRLDGSSQPTELVPLVQQFNELLVRLQAAFDHLEGFNADVAHELATPLSTLIGSTEIALRRERPAAELRTVLECNLEELQRMARIVQDMLFLAQSDHGTLARREPVHSLAELAHRVATYHEAALEEGRLTVALVGDASADIDSSLVERALSNLLANATQYATPGTVVRITIRARGLEVDLQVDNDGPGIPSDQIGRIFDRFYRADTARVRANRHHGLGLSIVAAIARMHGGAPFARSSGGRTVVGVTLRALSNAGGVDTAPRGTARAYGEDGT